MAVAGLLTEPPWLGQETGHSERFPEELRRYSVETVPWHSGAPVASAGQASCANCLSEGIASDAGAAREPSPIVLPRDICVDRENLPYHEDTKTQSF